MPRQHNPRHSARSDLSTTDSVDTEGTDTLTYAQSRWIRRRAESKWDRGDVVLTSSVATDDVGSGTLCQSHCSLPSPLLSFFLFLPLTVVVMLFFTAQTDEDAIDTLDGSRHRHSTTSTLTKASGSVDLEEVSHGVHATTEVKRDFGCVCLGSIGSCRSVGFRDK